MTWSARLLRPSPKALLAARVEQLTQTRAAAIAAHSAELRRIERDLHDGAQARLVANSCFTSLNGTRWLTSREKRCSYSAIAGVTSKILVG